MVNIPKIIFEDNEEFGKLGTRLSQMPLAVRGVRAFCGQKGHSLTAS